VCLSQYLRSESKRQRTGSSRRHAYVRILAARFKLVYTSTFSEFFSTVVLALPIRLSLWLEWHVDKSAGVTTNGTTV